jgi:methenyltetrahydrofolate cyclohydrolase
VAVLAAHAGLRSAALNVDINVPSIKDADFVRSRRDRLIDLLQRAAAIGEETVKVVHGRLA